MSNPLRNLLTADEQKVLLGFCLLMGLGMILNFLGWSPILAKESTAADSLMVKAIQEDHMLRLDIRTATMEELIQLPGIGEKRALEIIRQRELSPFISVYDLRRVKGIGEKTMQNILPHLMLLAADSTKTPPVQSSPNPSKSSAKTTDSTPRKSDDSRPVSLNSATLEEFMTLDGIGKVKAEAILEYRKSKGSFGSIEEFTQVKGIGPKTLEKNRHRLRL